jgi:hypothetical protein
MLDDAEFEPAIPSKDAYSFAARQFERLAKEVRRDDYYSALAPSIHRSPERVEIAELIERKANEFRRAAQ